MEPPTNPDRFSGAPGGSGDSGGLVYHYRPSDGTRWPSGIIDARDDDTGDCGYVALDDQLAGTGWTLK